MKIINAAIIFFLIELSVPGLLAGQSYQTIFGNDTTQWNIKREIPDYLNTTVYKSFGDTIINAKLYKPVYEYDQYDIQRVGYMREEAISGKIWFLFPDGEEKLIMDLTLNKNDTFIITETHWCTVDTVFHTDGKKNIVFNEPINYSDTLKFIESIGPNNLFNFLAFYPVWLENSVILCSYKDNIQVYKNNNYNDCFLGWTSVVEINNAGEPLVYPNPCSGILTVKVDDPDQCASIQIFSIDGKVVLQFENIQESNDFDLTGIPVGVYFIHFTCNEGNNVSSVIKQ